MIIPRNHEDLLRDILSTLSLEIRGKGCIGYQSIPLSTSSISYLSIPAGAVTAGFLSSAANAGATKAPVVVVTARAMAPAATKRFIQLNMFNPL